MIPGKRNVQAARKRLAGRGHVTPMLSSTSLSEMAGVEVAFKCENLQRSGSFKYRGALNAVLSLTANARRRGVVTHSSGNHGAALAAVARDLKIPATIVVPRNASAYKRANIARYGGRIVLCGNTLAARERALTTQVSKSGATFIPPYDHPAVIAGQGTATLEILEQLPDVDEIWAPVGGGGLVSGAVIATQEIGEMEDRVQVVGAEPELARDAYDSMTLGQRQPALPPLTIADGLRTALGELNFRILKRYKLPIHLVGENDIVAAQQLAMSCLKVLIEPSSALPIAALLKHGPRRAASRRVVVIITGGNLQV